MDRIRPCQIKPNPHPRRDGTPAPPMRIYNVCDVQVRVLPVELRSIHLTIVCPILQALSNGLKSLRNRPAPAGYKVTSTSRGYGRYIDPNVGFYDNMPRDDAEAHCESFYLSSS